jgi:hypothetical protein
MKKVLFLCKKRLSYGNTYGLMNSAKFVSSFLESNNVLSKTVEVVDANSVDKEVTDYDPSHVIIEAIWIVPAKMREIMSLRRHWRRTWIIRLHSRASFIANEGIAFPWLAEYKNIPGLTIAPNVKEFSEDLAKTFKLKTKYLPNIYYPPKYDYSECPVIEKLPGEIHIGCFGSLRPMKNHLTQAIAAVKFANNKKLKLKFHINGTRSEQGGDQVFKNLVAYFNEQITHELVPHDWLSHPDFCGLVKQMDIGMQVSFSETFNIVAADFVDNSIPFIGSEQITWLPGVFQVSDSNSTQEIAKALDFAWSWIGRFLKRLSSVTLCQYNLTSGAIWLDFVDKYRTFFVQPCNCCK